ncbi:serine protease [Candidatus Bipolaricaulota bacterium]|nr:serine protease [Candidatus Bipolaricaulota bacterium]
MTDESKLAAENLHSPTSNEPEEAVILAPKEPVTEPPSEGENRESAPVADEVEEVPGHTKSEMKLSGTFAIPDLSGLRDIGEASFGEPGPVLETVHGHDDRVRITNTSVYPWRVHCSLLITARDNSRWIGTGWFIGPRTVMTAGHVVYIKNSGVSGRDGWVKKIDVMPGRNGGTLPYGLTTSYSFRSVKGWTDSGSQYYDYGAIILSTSLGNRTGWLGFGVYGDSDLCATTGNISGYPGDKPSGTQWYDYHKIASVSSRKVYYDIDTAGGQSGSAVYRIKNGKRYGFAIHAYGGTTTNSGTRIVKPVFDNMVKWKA